MKQYKTQIAYCSKWSLPVFVDDEGNVFYQITATQIKLPFVTEEKYRLIDAHDLHSMTSKFIMAEMRVKKLTEQVEAGYNSQYLHKYFNEKVIDVPTFEMVNKIVCKYSDFLEYSVFGKGKWGERVREVKDSKAENIDIDLAIIEIFMEFLCSEEE